MEPPCDVKALYEYKSEHSDDLNFEAGQIIHVDSIEDEEWLNGSYTTVDGRQETGMFPKTFVEVLKHIRDTSTTAQKPELRSVIDTKAESAADHSISTTSDSERRQERDLSATEPPTSESSGVKSSAEGETQLRERAAQSDASCMMASSVTPFHRLIELVPETDETETQVPSDPKRSTTTESSLHGSVDKAPDRTTTKVPAQPKEGETNSNTSKSESASASTATAMRSVIPSDEINPVLQAPKALPSEKPLKSNAFRDRIAAFNKQETNPIAPKPMVKPSFAKKPFVAPPPSKDSYIPPIAAAKPKPQTEMLAQQTPDHPDMPHSRGPESEADPGEAAPKIGSLKERIAALKAEQSQLAAKKTATKAAPPQTADTERVPEAPQSKEADAMSTRSDVVDPEAVSVLESRETRPPVPRMPSESKYDSEPRNTKKEPAVESSDNESDVAEEQTDVQSQHTESPIGSEEESVLGDTTVSDPHPLSPPPVPHQSRAFAPDTIERQEHPTIESDYSAGHIPASDASITAGNPDTSGVEVQSSEDEMDEEERRKLALRERMAKMSGGMGMGMHMALGLGSGRSSKPKSTPKAVEPDVDESERLAPIPMPGLPSLPIPRPVIADNTEAPSVPDDHTAIKSATERVEEGVETSGAQSDLPGLPVVSGPPVVPAARPQAPSVPTHGGQEAATTSHTSTVEPQGEPTGAAQSSPSQRVPPPIPSSRPPVAAEQRAPPPPIPSTRPSMDIDSTLVPDSRALRVDTQPQTARYAPPAEFSDSAVATKDSIADRRPPIPLASAPARPPVTSPPMSPTSPSMTPGGTKRMSYFGPSSSPPPPVPRASIDSSIRESVDMPRASFDTLSRTSSARIEPPSRPPPPTIPATRAPPPPVPSSAAPSRAPPAPATHAASPSVSRPQEDYSYEPALPQTSPNEPIGFPVEHQPQSGALSTSETERGGYEADDDLTDVPATRTSLSGFDGLDGSSSYTSSSPGGAPDRAPAKKKGIKGLFKRKDKDGK